MRSALGAGRERLAQQLLAKSVLLSLVGGAFGIVFASWLLRLIPHITAFTLPRAKEIQLDWPVLPFYSSQPLPFDVGGCSGTRDHDEPKPSGYQGPVGVNLISKSIDELSLKFKD